ncbi:hypothetical protein SUGI_0664770 [Cryptomeria japonica]|uniref:G-type lectin S-receptor-like serine/threonine-protein kinase B120 n=1 Tax=Cryptomeria japonica TaxID=3369 RepID=UPI002414A0B9|nr:G-type lectin S-receptor-like serine/threonine-protein kinase B120 [Cryptomeria japonica]GLJ33015.1 hypothetical protein SUGI_0664770 [Cryptomeria japonica]
MDRSAFNCLKRFILALALIILQRSCHLFVAAGDTLSLGASLRKKHTIISKNGTFELGFFNPNGTNNWYVGIWYAHIPDKTIVWVANRETPITSMPGVLTLSSIGYLTLSDLQGKVIWLSNDTGNFVLFGAQNTSQIVWERFGDPTDTFYSPGDWTGSYFTTFPAAPSYSILKEEFVVFSPTRMFYTYKLGARLVR